MQKLSFFPQIKNSTFLHSQWKFLLLLFLMIGLTNIYAQEDPTNNFSCTILYESNKSTANDTIGETVTLRSACTSSTATKYVNVNVNFILKSDGTGNYNETSDGLGGPVSGYQIAYEVIKTANDLFANNQQVYQPVGNTTSNLPIRIQYLLKGVHFIRNTTAYNYNGSNLNSLDALTSNPSSEINIFIAGASTGSSGITTLSDILYGSPLMLVGEQMWNSYNHGYTKTVSYQGTPILFKHFYYAHIINHELGHVLGLNHPFGCPNTSNPDGCTDTYTFCPKSNFEPIAPQTNPYNGQSCPTSPTNTCSNTFLDYHINHAAVTPCQITTMHNSLQTTAGMNYYDCNCLNPVSSFYLLYGSSGTLYLECSEDDATVSVFIDASATQYENTFEVTVMDVNFPASGYLYSKIYYGPASTIDLRNIYPYLSAGSTYQVTLRAINTCAESTYTTYISIQYQSYCGGWFLSLSPNPASQTLKIEYNLDIERETDTEITITEFNNPTNRSIVKLKSKEPKGKHEMQLNTSTLRNGMYVVTLKTPEKTLSQKVQILH